MFVPKFFDQQQFTTNFTKPLFERFNLPKVQNNVAPKISLKAEKPPNYDSAHFSGVNHRMPLAVNAYSPPIQTEIINQNVNDKPFTFHNPLSDTDLFYFRSGGPDYSEKDAIAYHWRNSNEAYQIALADMREQMEANKGKSGAVELNINFVQPAQEEYDAFVEQLRANGIDKAIDWKRIESEVKPKLIMNPAISESRIDQLSSLYAVMRDRIEKEFSGDEQTEQLKQLDKVVYGMIESDAEKFAERYGSVLGDKDGFKNSILNLYNERIKEYQSYMATKLRDAENAGKPDTGASSVANSSDNGYYTLSELNYAVKVAAILEYDMSRFTLGKSEAEIGLQFAYYGMQIETFCESGLVGTKMANTIRAAFSSSVEKHSGKYILDIFNQTMDAFRRTKDALKAIQQGVEYSKQLLQSSRYNQYALNTYLHKNSLSYSDNFYNDTKWQASGINGSVGYVSPYQQYSDGWNFFVDSLKEGKLVTFVDYNHSLNYLY